MKSKLVKHNLEDYKSDVTKEQVLKDIDKACLFKVTKKRVLPQPPAS